MTLASCEGSYNRMDPLRVEVVVLHRPPTISCSSSIYSRKACVALETPMLTWKAKRRIDVKADSLGVSLVEMIQRSGSLGLLMLAVGALQIGCTPSRPALAPQVEYGRPVTTSQLTAQLALLQSPENKDIYTQARAAKLSDVFTQNLNLIPNTAVQIGGHTFYNLHDILMKNAASLQQTANAYGTVGNYADKMGATNLSAITAAKIQAVFDRADRMLNASTATATSSTVNNANGLQLTAKAQIRPGRSMAKSDLFDKNCFISALNMIGAAAGTGAECAATLGLGCAVGVAGTAAATNGAVNNCGDDPAASAGSAPDSVSTDQAAASQPTPAGGYCDSSGLCGYATPQSGWCDNNGNCGYDSLPAGAGVDPSNGPDITAKAGSSQPVPDGGYCDSSGKCGYSEPQSGWCDNSGNCGYDALPADSGTTNSDFTSMGNTASPDQSADNSGDSSSAQSAEDQSMYDNGWDSLNSGNSSTDTSNDGSSNSSDVTADDGSANSGAGSEFFGDGSNGGSSADDGSGWADNSGSDGSSADDGSGWADNSGSDGSGWADNSGSDGSSEGSYGDTGWSNDGSNG